MENIHRGIGEGLFAVYVVVMIVTIIMANRDQRPPAWLVGIAHGLLGIQVILGIILVSGGLGGVPWYHPILGLLALAALGLTPILRKRFGRGTGLAAVFGIIAVLTLAAQLAARLG